MNSNGLSFFTKLLLFLLLIYVFSFVIQFYVESTNVSIVNDANASFDKVVFCPEQNCLNELTNFLSSASNSIDCAVYDIKLNQVKDILLKKSIQGLNIRIVSDDLQAQNNSSVLPDLVALGVAKLDQSKSDYMHNKFCIVDNNVLLLGSMNFTENGVKKNNNNFVILTNVRVINNFENEFNELWNKNFGILSSRNTINSLDSAFLSCFNPEDNCKNLLISFIRGSKHSIDCMLFSFTLSDVAQELSLKSDENALVRIILEKTQNSSYSVFHSFNDSKINFLLDKNPNNMHNKFCVFDNNVVLTGSSNFSRNGFERNDESMLFIKSSRLAKKYSDYFNSKWLEWSH